DGAQRSRLQSDAGYEHRRYQAADGGDPDMKQLRTLRSSLQLFGPPSARYRTWGNSGIVPYEGTGNQLSRNRQRPTSWSLAIMESRNGALCRTRRFAEADSDLHRRSDRKDRARRGRCIQPGGNRRIHQVARAACRTDRARDGSNVDMAM